MNTVQSQAHEAGYTQPLTVLTYHEGALYVWARPDADFDSEFAVICAETGERLRIVGWNVDIESGHV